MNTKLSVSECLRSGWATFKKRPWFFVGATIVIVLAGWAIGFVGSLVQEIFTEGGATGLGGVVSFIVSFLLQTLLGMGTIALYLKAYESAEGASLMDLWHPQNFLLFLGTSILVALAVIGGLILLIIPGIIFALMFQFATYLVVARGMTPIAAMKESARITRGNKWRLVLLALTIVGLQILGFIALIVGLLVAIPVSTLMIIHAFRTLEHKVNEVAPAAPAMPTVPPTPTI